MSSFKIFPDRSTIRGKNKTIRIEVKTGGDIHIDTNLPKVISGQKSSKTSALLGRDFPGTRFQVLTEPGALVKAGESVLADRRQPEIVFTSPVSGTVTGVHRGERRALVALEITSDNQDLYEIFDIPQNPAQQDILNLMLQSGLWTSMRCRPFGGIPDPNRKPKALFVTAIDTEPLAPDPAIVIREFSADFSLGVETISKLVNTPVYLCKTPGSEFGLDYPENVTVAEFHGKHPAGLPGVHIHTLCPIGFDGSEVWHIGYQDIISLGILMRTGIPWYQRIVSLSGPPVKNPRLITIPLGADLVDITDGELQEEPVRIISGSPLSGHLAQHHEAYLGQRHSQVTVISEGKPGQPGKGRYALPDIGYNGEPGPFIPTTNLDRVAPPGILATPFLRSLIVGDIERCRDLGALELVEEDLALLSYVCPSKRDYGVLLRDVLGQLQKEELSSLG